MFLSGCMTFVYTFLCCHCAITTWKRLIHHLHISHNALCLSPKILHNLCFSFLLDITAVPREIENNACAKICWASKVHYGRCASGELHVLWRTVNKWRRNFSLSKLECSPQEVNSGDKTRVHFKIDVSAAVAPSMLLRFLFKWVNNKKRQQC